jgi:hypothetical protein
MTPEEALDLLNRAAAMVPSDRDGHAKIIEAVNVLGEAIAPPPKAE